jgi:thiol-disulfide isomerase/thioredoxin
MKNILLGILLFPVCMVAQTKKVTSATSTKTASTGHAIQIILKPYQNTKIYIGTNYGNNKVLADSCILNDKSEGLFQSKDKLTPGIYFVVSPKMSILFDFLIDDKQAFKIVADTLDLKNISIIGSNDNTLFQNYSKEINKLFVELNSIENNYKNAKNEKDSARFKEAYLIKDKEIKQNRKTFIEKNPNSMMAFLLNTMQVPDAPSIPIINGKADSLYPYRFVKDHYWDNVVFNDNRLIRTPFFEKKLDDYFKNYVSREPDSIIEEVQYMLTVAKTGKEIYPFLLFKFTNKYISPEFMGQDKVFLHIYQNFFAKGDTVLLNEASKKSLRDRAYSLMANQLGLPAPILVLNDVEDKRFALHTIKAPYTFIAFWDPTCSHCKVEIPKLDSIYKASWKGLSVKVVSVNINTKELSAWKKFITDHQLEGWINGYQTEEDLNREIKEGKPTTIRQLYDVYKTPTFYLLDKDKKIIAKNLSIEQFNDFLQATIKKTN